MNSWQETDLYQTIKRKIDDYFTRFFIHSEKRAQFIANISRFS